MAYETTIVVNFGDIDPAQIVYYPNIFHYCHIAFERFFAEYAGIAYARVIGDERVGFPTVNASANFFNPIKYGEHIQVAVSIGRIGESSVEFRYHGSDSAGKRYFEAN